MRVAGRNGMLFLSLFIRLCMAVTPLANDPENLKLMQYATPSATCALMFSRKDKSTALRQLV